MNRNRNELRISSMVIIILPLALLNHNEPHTHHDFYKEIKKVDTNKTKKENCIIQ